MIYLDNAATTKRMKTLSKKCFLISQRIMEMHQVYMI